MTVSNVNPYEAPVTVTSNVNTYSFNFDASDESHVHVQMQKTDTPTVELEQGTHYTVTFAADPGVGGSVTLGTGIALQYDTYSIVIYRKTIVEQNVSLPNQGPYFSETIEGMHDKTTMVLQENEYNVRRSLLAPVGQVGGVLSIGSEGTIPVWGSGSALNSSSTTISQVAAWAQTVQDSATAAANSAAAAANSAATASSVSTDNSAFFTRPEPFYNEDDGDNWAPAINAAIQHAKLVGSPSTVLLAGRAIYGIREHIQLESEVTLMGTGRQANRIQALTAMTEMIRPADTSGATRYFRFSIKRLWLDGNSLASTGVMLVANKHGFFEEVYVSDTVSQGWWLRDATDYNIFIACDHVGGGRGWVISTTLTNPPSENTWLFCSKRNGTDGWHLRAFENGFNSQKLVNCMVEDHTGHAFYAAGSATSTGGGPAYVHHIVLMNFRVDSQAVSANGIIFDNQYVLNASITNYRGNVPGDVLSNYGTQTTFDGFPFTVAFEEVLDFQTIPANGFGRLTVNVPGVSPTGWVVIAHEATQSLPDGLFTTASVHQNDQVEIEVRNSTGVAMDPTPQAFIGMVKRIK